MVGKKRGQLGETDGHIQVECLQRGVERMQKSGERLVDIITKVVMDREEVINVLHIFPIGTGYSGSVDSRATVRTVPRAPQDHRACGHQVAVSLEGGGHGGKDSLQRAIVVALDIPAGLFDVRS